MNNLINQNCVPCKGGVDPFTSDQINYYLRFVKDWKAVDGKEITKDFTFKDFKLAIKFVNKVADIAENEGHHPDILIHNWSKVQITLSTFAIKGLSQNDFIIAAKIDYIDF